MPPTGALALGAEILRPALAVLVKRGNGQEPNGNVGDPHHGEGDELDVAERNEEPPELGLRRRAAAALTVDGKLEENSQHGQHEGTGNVSNDEGQNMVNESWAFVGFGTFQFDFEIATSIGCKVSKGYENYNLAESKKDGHESWSSKV
jgi:hypothetical protein